MKRIREVLLTQYIGAITIGFVLAQTVTGFISGLVQTGANYYFARGEPGSVMGGAPVFPWKTLMFWLITAALQLLVAFLLITWLYAPEKDKDQDAENVPAESPQP